MLLLAIGTMLITLMSRIVIETGLFWVGPTFWPKEIFISLLGRGMLSAKSFFWTEVMSPDLLWRFARKHHALYGELASDGPGHQGNTRGWKGQMVPLAGGCAHGEYSRVGSGQSLSELHAWPIVDG